MGGNTTTLGAGEEKRAIAGVTAEEAEKLSAGITAKGTITELNEAIDHGRMTYTKLIDILGFYLKKSIDEKMMFKPEGVPNFSLKKMGLKKLYKALEKMEKKAEKTARRNGERHDCP